MIDPGGSVEAIKHEARLFRGDILDMSTLTPHGACLDWRPDLIWLNVVSDTMAAFAFFATAFVIGF
jgi:hypothetical protein